MSVGKIFLEERGGGGGGGGGGQRSTMVSILTSGPSCPGFNVTAFPIFFQKFFFVNVAEVNQWRCLEESGQLLENVDQTHLVLSSGRLVLQKEQS